MAPRQNDLQTEISTLRHELELSTFLNKGILQSNAEYKLRIAELEAENTLLQAAESRLASTEDALEIAEKRVKELEKDRSVVLRENRRLESEVSGLERERDGWRVRFESVKGYWGSVLGGMKDVLEVLPPHPASTRENRQDNGLSKSGRKSTSGVDIIKNAMAGPSSARKSKPRTSTGKDKSTAFEPEEINDTTDLPNDVRSSTTKRRRKLSSSPPVEEDPASPSISPPPRQTPLAGKSRAQSHSTTKKRPTSNHRSRKNSDDIVLRPKDEPISPETVVTREQGKRKAPAEDSDDDPLAMS